HHVVVVDDQNRHAFFGHDLSAVPVEKNQCRDGQGNCGNRQADTPDQCLTCLMMGGALFEFKILLKLSQGQEPREKEENHSTKQENDHAVGHFPTAAGRVAQGHQDGISLEGKTTDQVGEKGEETDQADDQPGLPAPELGQRSLNVVNDPFHAFLPRFVRVRCAKFGKS
ncbi:MAG TPA: hypothetical protein VLA64_05490, partial [Azonexus sp.]|nr:hypothetical protein [Azonexus sp.]